MFAQIRPRLWRWELPHPDWIPDLDEAAGGGWEKIVASYAAVAEDTLLLIDPLAPEGGSPQAERFWDALDGDVAHHGPPNVVLTIFWHARSAPAILDRYEGARLWAYEPAAGLVRERTPVTDTFAAGGELPGGLRAIDAGRGHEVVLWLPSHRGLVVGDVLLGSADGGARLCPESWLGAGKTYGDLRRALEPALALPLELLLLTHGEVVENDAAGVLRRAIGGAGA